MIQEVATILKQRLMEGSGLPFVDVYAGIAQTVEYREQVGEGAIIKRMPVSHDTNISQECTTTPEKAIIPDSKKRGVVYFEDNGAIFVDYANGGALNYRASLNLICWMNRARSVGDHYKNISSYAITAIIEKLKPKGYSNEANLSRFKVTPGRIFPQNNTVFAKYSYDETITQYLRPPFEFFGMEIIVEFSINKACIEQITFNEIASCY